MIPEAEQRRTSYDRQLAEIKAMAAKRFWEVVAEDDTGNRFFIVDGRGRVICPPSHFMSLRGFFAGQPAQA